MMDIREQFQAWLETYGLTGELRKEEYELMCDSYIAGYESQQSKIADMEKRLSIQYIDLDRLIGALEKIAVFGSNCAPYYGNSEVNMIARQALAYAIPKVTEIN